MGMSNLRSRGTVGRFSVGDVVRNGTRIATVTDVGTVLVAVTTAMGTPRMVCPWELVRLRASCDVVSDAAPWRKG